MLPQVCLLVVCALVSLHNLVYGILPVLLLCFFHTLYRWRCKAVERQSHEDAVEPYLVGIDSLVPPHSLVGARLLLKLAEQGVDGLVKVFGREEAVHAVDELCRAYVVEVVVLQLVAGYVAVGINHRVGVFAEVFYHLLVFISQVGVEHALHLYAHHVAPFRFFREIQQEALWVALHLRPCHPLRVVLVWLVGIGQYQLSVDEQVVVFHVACLARHLYRLFHHTLELAVLYRYVVYVLNLVKSDNQHAVVALLAGDVLHVHLSYGRLEATVAQFLWFVVEVYLQHGLTALSYCDIPHVDVLDETTAAVVGLYAQYAVEVGRVHVTVLCIHVLASARNLGAYYNSSVSVLHLAVAYYDVLAWRVPQTSVVVASALYGYAVVARMESAVLYQYVLACLGVASVAVRSLVPDVYSVNGDVF